MHPTLVGRTDAMMFGAEGTVSNVLLKESILFPAYFTRMLSVPVILSNQVSDIVFISYFLHTAASFDLSMLRFALV